MNPPSNTTNEKALNTALERVVFNVGGTRFETWKETVGRLLCIH